MKSLYPLVITSKLHECADFYAKHFGFEKVFEADWYVQLVHKTKQDQDLAFMAPNAESQPKALHPAFSGNGVLFTLVVENAQKEYERIKKAGIPIVFDLKTEDFGKKQKHFIVRDPAGVFVDVLEWLE